MNYYCVVSYRGEEVSVLGSWDPVEKTITCAERNVSTSLLCSI